MSKRKVLNPKNNPNFIFCEFLLELADNEKNVNNNVYKYKAYRKAALILSLQSKRISSGDEAKKLEGIGKKIALKIDEFIQTGKLQKLEDIKQDDTSKSINLLARVSGIGPAKAKKLVEKGIKTIEDLKKHPNEITNHQKIGLKYFEDFEKKIPREEILEIKRLITYELKRTDPDYTITICGSFRRGKPESGDIDILLTHPSYISEGVKDKCNLLKVIVLRLQSTGLITEMMSLGTTKFLGACRLPKRPSAITRRIDIRLTPFDQYYYSVLYFTGSDMFNQKMRQYAHEQGFILNEYSLRKLGVTGVPGSPIPITSEKDIFEYLDYPYKEPSERE